MKVIHVITGLGQGGAEAMLEKLVLVSLRLDPAVEHEVISLGAIGEIGIRLASLGVPVRALGMTRPFGVFVALPRLVRWLRASGPHSIVQTWMYHADLVGGLAAKLAGRPNVVWNVRQTGLDLRDIGRSTRAVVRACAALSRWLPRRIVCNAHAAIAAHVRVGYVSTRFTIIPNGFDVQHFARDADARQRVRAAWRIAEGEIAIGMVGRLDPQKDHANFIAMASRVAQELPQARFVLVGRGIPADHDLAAAVADAGLADRVVLEDQRADIPQVMSALDIFCLSSRAEGFPNVLGEAMASETPSVSTDAGDARMLLGDDALVVPIECAPALAACVLRIARASGSERRRLGAAQRRRIESEFEIAKIWQRYRDLYANL